MNLKATISVIFILSFSSANSEDVTLEKLSNEFQLSLESLTWAWDKLTNQKKYGGKRSSYTDDTPNRLAGRVFISQNHPLNVALRKPVEKQLQILKGKESLFVSDKADSEIPNDLFEPESHYNWAIYSTENKVIETGEFSTLKAEDQAEISIAIKAIESKYAEREIRALLTSSLFFERRLNFNGKAVVADYINHR